MLLFVAVCAVLVTACGHSNSPPQQPTQALTELERLERNASAGNAEAQYKLAMRYSAGDGVAKNTDVSQTWLRKSASAGNVDAMLELAIQLRQGKNAKAKEKEVREWLTRASGAGSGRASYVMAQSFGFLIYGDSLPIGDTEFDTYSERDYGAVTLEKYIEKNELDVQTNTENAERKVENGTCQ